MSPRESIVVIALRAGPGAVRHMAFGSCILLHPKRVTAEAQAVIGSLQPDVAQRGGLTDERVSEGERFDVMSVRRWRDKALGQDMSNLVSEDITHARQL